MDDERKRCWMISSAILFTILIVFGAMGAGLLISYFIREWK